MPPALTRLPYLGQRKPRAAASSPVLEISMSDLSDYEAEQVAAKLHPQDDPLVTLTNKVERLAELLNCSEADAERLLFDRL